MRIALPRRAAAALVALLLATGCSRLALFDALVPKDRGGVRVAQELAYGPDPRQRLDVYAPREGGGGPRPVVVFFYGGSWSSGERAGYAFVGRALAARGLVVVVPDYRLVPRVRYPAFVEDGAAAVRWAAAHAATYGGAPDAIGVMGHSAGAYIAAMLAVDDRWLGADRARIRCWSGWPAPTTSRRSTWPRAATRSAPGPARPRRSR